MRGFGLIASFDYLHNMSDLGALAHGYEALTPAGTVMLVGPCASDDVASDLNPLGTAVLFRAILRIPAALSQDAGASGHRIPNKE